MKYIYLACSLFFLCVTAFTQNKDLFKKIEIKKSFENAIDKSKPAIAGFTIASGTNNYYTINGGIAYRVSKLGAGIVSTKTKVDIFSVYNRNNQIKKEQNNFKAGVSLEKKVIFIKKDMTPKDLLLFFNFSNEYIHDRIDTTKSFASLLYISPYFRLSEKMKIGKPVMSASGDILSYVRVTPGIEYQNKFEVPASSNKGSLMRLFFSASYEWYFRWREKPGDNSSDWVNMFELSSGYTYRNDFYNNTNQREGYLPLFNFTAAFYPFRNNNVSVGASYQKGSDPVNGIDEQEFWQFVFKFKKDLK